MNSPKPDRIKPPFLTSSQQLTELPFPVTRPVADLVVPIEQISPAFLAYLGDAVYELYVRSYYLLPPRRIRDYHNQVVGRVRAETQATELPILEPYLTDGEREILRRGRNAATGCPRRLSPAIYQQATSLETLIGYLYLQNPERLAQLLAQLRLTWENRQQEPGEKGKISQT